MMKLNKKTNSNVSSWNISENNKSVEEEQNIFYDKKESLELNSILDNEITEEKIILENTNRLKYPFFREIMQRYLIDGFLKRFKN